MRANVMVLTYIRQVGYSSISYPTLPRWLELCPAAPVAVALSLPPPLSRAYRPAARLVCMYVVLCTRLLGSYDRDMPALLQVLGAAALMRVLMALLRNVEPS